MSENYVLIFVSTSAQLLPHRIFTIVTTQLIANLIWLAIPFLKSSKFWLHRNLKYKYDEDKNSTNRSSVYLTFATC